MYAAFDNNGDLICLCISKEDAIETADDHYKDAAEDEAATEFLPPDAPVYSGNRFIGSLQEVSQPITLTEAAEIVPLAYATLAQAAREGRIEARRSGATWLTTRAAIEQAIENGNLRPRDGLPK